jgi:hypothetical protein
MTAHAAAVRRALTFDRVLPVLAPLAAVLAAWAYINQPMLVGLFVATLLCLPLLQSPALRVVWVVFGTVVFFGTTDELTAGKLAFLYGLAFALTGSLFRARSAARTEAFRLVAPLFVVTVTFCIVAVVSGVVSTLHGTPQTNWLRDLAPYVLFAAVPLLALDAASSFGKRGLERLLVAAGLAAALSFAVKFVTVRGIADLSSLPAGFPSTLLAAALASYAIAKLLNASGRRSAWLLVGAVTLAALLVTGTRTTLILLIAPFVMVFAIPAGFGARLTRLAVALPLLALAIGISLQSIVKASSGDEDILKRRVELLLDTGGGRDQSFADRITQTEVAREIFEEYPLLGAGPGIEFVWHDTFGERFVGLTVDTPISFLSKFGLLGLLWVAVTALAYWRFFRNVRERGTLPTTAQLGLVGFGSIVAAHSLLHVSLEDKGLAPALVLLVALAMRERLHASEAEPATAEGEG